MPAGSRPRPWNVSRSSRICSRYRVPQIAEIRGVNSDSTVRTLLERELVTEVGRSSAAGRGPALRDHAPLRSRCSVWPALDELPPLEGFALTEDQKDDLRRRLGLLTVPE